MLQFEVLKVMELNQNPLTASIEFTTFQRALELADHPIRTQTGLSYIFPKAYIISYIKKALSP